MAIVKMKKATIIALQSEKEILTKALQEFGGLHMLDIREEVSEHEDIKLSKGDVLQGEDAADEVNRLEARLSQVKYALEFIKRFGTIKKSMFAPKVEVDEDSYIRYLQDEPKINQIVDSCREIDSKFAELKSKETKTQNTISQLLPWKDLDMRLEEIKASRYTIMSIGFVASKYTDDFKAALNSIDEKVYIETISIGRENTYMLIVCHTDIEDNVVQSMKQFGWSKVAFNDITGTPAENIKKLNDELRNIESVRNSLAEKGKELIDNNEYLEIMHDILSIERDKKDVTSNFVKTEKTVLISGWIPEKVTNDLEAAIAKITESYSLEFQEPREDELYPTLLDNPSFAQPVEFITDQYSIPSSKGVDPNIIMAPFFIMFFGLMVSDAVYGILVATISALLLLKIKPQGNFKKLVGLMALGGAATAFWGIMFGGWLGGMIRIPAIMFDPLQEPFAMIGLCVGMGILHLFVGMGLQAYKNIRNGNVLDAVFDQGFWYLLLIGILMLALPATAIIGKYMAITGAAGLVLTQGRTEKNIIKRLLSGVLSLYNITGFLGDALSYLRLFALGLATGVIGQVINSMALMLGGTIIGSIIMVIVLIFGHTFNIGINVLGAYVHSSRLQYVEFFSKFYEGDGIQYNPFRIKTKFIVKK